MLLNPRISRTGLSPMSILLYIYDGIPRQLVPDNLNTSVKKANDYLRSKETISGIIVALCEEKQRFEQMRKGELEEARLLEQAASDWDKERKLEDLLTVWKEK